jgi:FkbM family methyltransferase
MSFSQNNESEIIKSYFKESIGAFLEIGSNDGKTLSNCYQLALDGWSGVCVEPSPKVWMQLNKNHLKHNKVQLLNVGIADYNGKAKFFDSGTLLKTGDSALVSTIDESETTRWKRSGIQFEETEIDVIDFKTLLELSEYKTFDLISIDCEGKDYNVLSQIDLKKVGCKMLIVEWNGKDKPLYQLYCESFGMKLIAENGENLIFAI